MTYQGLLTVYLVYLESTLTALNDMPLMTYQGLLTFYLVYFKTTFYPVR